MEYRRLGHTDLQVSELCLGSMQFGWTADELTSHLVLDAAYAAGINFVDTADIYSNWVAGNPGGVSEQIIGRWMKKSSISRDRIVLATKVRGKMSNLPGDEGLSRIHILQAVEASLHRLGTDYIDLYQAHWFDENIPIEETLEAMDRLVRQGKIRYTGCSNYPAWRLSEALCVSRHRGIAGFVSLQPHYNLLHRAEFERELADVCRAYGLAVLPYSPLAGGFLTGKYRSSQPFDSQRQRSAQRYFKDRNWEVLRVLDEVAKEAGDRSMSQIALAWLLSNPIVTSPIIGPRTIEQLQDNLDAAGFRLPADQMEAINSATSWKD